MGARKYIVPRYECKECQLFQRDQWGLWHKYHYVCKHPDAAVDSTYEFPWGQWPTIKITDIDLHFFEAKKYTHCPRKERTK